MRSMNFHPTIQNATANMPDDNALSALYVCDEKSLVSVLAATTALSINARETIAGQAANWVKQVRAASQKSGMIDAFLQEYGLSTQEGIILMRLSEALIRTPDFTTAQALMRDKLTGGAWAEHAGRSPSLLINGATSGLRLTATWISASGGKGAANLAAKMGDRVLHAAVVRGMGIMAEHFVLGSSIENAVKKSIANTAHNDLYSFDMLGEGACTDDDAERYFNAYAHAVRHLAEHAKPGAVAATSNGISVKLSALHPRYEYAKRAECVPDLVKRVHDLAVIARDAGVGLTLDAEEADRLEISLIIFEQLLALPELAGWDGLGIVIQAYQRRATATIDAVVAMASKAKRRIAVRLVKGAYWDMEIKRAQEMGLESYPVFTCKEHTDISYLACAQKLLSAGQIVYPQFATHNAHSAAAIIAMAQGSKDLEFQRLHGMGELLHSVISEETGIRTRVYAPVGGHKELLPYLVRRLLENGANSSFVNQLLNPEIEIDDIVRDPISIAQEHGFASNSVIPIPRDMFGGSRLGAVGMDLTQSIIAAQMDGIAYPDLPLAAASIIDGKISGADQVEIRNPARPSQIVGVVRNANMIDIEGAIAAAKSSNWSYSTSPQERADCLNRAADLIEADMPQLMALCVAEAGKTLPDAVAELREAVDFCRYYAVEAVKPRISKRAALGIVACISPWNFPLAIFMGQVTAALSMGNAVVAKPAAQTPLIAYKATQILHKAGIPTDALQLIIGGPETGAQLVGHVDVSAVCFTGSTATAKHIAASRADIGHANSVLIAETGGINAMIVDSTALLEQVVGDVVDSAFQSAGQRCSACRLICVQDEIADEFEKMLSGAMLRLHLSDPSQLSADIGPIIDMASQSKIAEYIAQSRQKFRVIGEARGADIEGHFITPIAFAMPHIADVTQEIFGPVLHVVRYAANAIDDVIDAINALGFGLTLGVHSRIDNRVQEIATRAKIGNVYVNRNQIGAVVGVQPFGGEGLSGTGPKAGGPHYLLRLSQTGNSAPAPSNNMPDLLRAYQQHFAGISLKTELPGPTGEQNSLSLVPRGHLILAGSLEHLSAQICACLASGNCGIIPTEFSNQASELLKQLALGRDGPITLSHLSFSQLLSTGIQGVIVDGQSKKDVANLLARRAGAIIPLLSIQDDQERFYHERTLTIDTTAAGGNASLLAMQSTGKQQQH
jgi:RHH-type transcriptional regulator, proline utilization regulon repressor / proline dehydrogenase / delta 1-pyrroline-5-carboxylate dehydrogenase